MTEVSQMCSLQSTANISNMTTRALRLLRNTCQKNSLGSMIPEVTCPDLYGNMDSTRRMDVEVTQVSYYQQYLYLRCRSIFRKDCYCIPPKFEKECQILAVS